MKVSNGDRTPSDLGRRPHQSTATTQHLKCHEHLPNIPRKALQATRVTARSRVAALAPGPLHLEVAEVLGRPEEVIMLETCPRLPSSGEVSPVSPPHRFLGDSPPISASSSLRRGSIQAERPDLPVRGGSPSIGGRAASERMRRRPSNWPGAVGLSERLLPASEVARNRFVYRDGGLRPVPVSPQTLFRSELLSPGGKAAGTPRGPSSPRR